MQSNEGNTGKITTGKSHRKSKLGELEKYRLLVKSVTDYAIFLMDSDGYIETWNAGAEKIKGYKPDEIIGKHFSNFYLPIDNKANKPERELELAIRYGRIEDEDWRVRKDGTKFWANVVITALFDASGDLIGFAKVTRDLTERKHQEDNLRDANVMLRQQQRDLEDLNNSKDEFISLASHQLRTPATGIKQYLGLLLEGFLGDITDEQRSAIQKAYESNEHQLLIVNDLLNVARVDAGRVILHKTNVNVTDLLQAVVDEYTENFAMRDQTVTFKSAKKVMANIDGVYFRMALENLIDNASKYTPDGGRIELAASTQNGMAVVSVKDNGVGVAIENIPLLFEKFKRIPNVLSDRADGSGLGLYWVQKIINLHGGTIDVESAAGKGTTFKVVMKQE